MKQKVFIWGNFAIDVETKFTSPDQRYLIRPDARAGWQNSQAQVLRDLTLPFLTTVPMVGGWVVFPLPRDLSLWMSQSIHIPPVGPGGGSDSAGTTSKVRAGTAAAGTQRTSQLPPTKATLPGKLTQEGGSHLSRQSRSSLAPTQCSSNRQSRGSPPPLLQCWANHWQPLPHRSKNHTGKKERCKSVPFDMCSMHQRAKSQQTAGRTDKRVEQGQKILGANLMSLSDGTENRTPLSCSRQLGFYNYFTL